MTMSSYLASPLSLGNMQGTDYLNAMAPMDLPDQRSNFDTETFVRCVRTSARPEPSVPPKATQGPCVRARTAPLVSRTKDEDPRIERAGR